MTEGLVSKRILLSLKAYCVANNIRIVKFHEQLDEDIEMEQELIDIAKNDIHITDFKGFRSIKFYKNPDIDKEIVEISQSKLIQEIIHQAEKSYNDSKETYINYLTSNSATKKITTDKIPKIFPSGNSLEGYTTIEGIYVGQFPGDETLYRSSLDTILRSEERRVGKEC